LIITILQKARIEDLDIEPLNDIIEELGGWPVVKGRYWPSQNHHYHWLNTYIMMRKIGLTAESLIRLSVGKDMRNNTRFIPYIDQPKFNINPNQLNNTDLYFNLMVQIAHMMGADKVDAQNELLQVLILEKELINV